MQNFSYENEFYLHVNENSFSYVRLCSKTRSEKGAQDNAEIACSFYFIRLPMFRMYNLCHIYITLQILLWYIVIGILRLISFFSALAF